MMALTWGVLGPIFGLACLTWVLVWGTRPMGRGIFWMFVVADAMCALLLVFVLLVLIGKGAD